MTETAHLLSLSRIKRLVVRDLLRDYSNDKTLLPLYMVCKYSSIYLNAKY